jgi:DNA-binding SARP family transcriptional activator
LLRLSTLGGLDLSAGGDQVHPLLSQPKRLGLLVYLSAAKSQGYRRRDTILPLFWPELDQDRARNALRQATYVLRRDLGDGVIRMHGEEELGVDPAKLWVDVTAFETAFAASEYRTAADLYRGDFLDGFFVSGAGAEFDEWVAGERDRLRGLASRAMWVAAEGAVTREPEAAAGWIRKALALAPDDELAVRQALDQLVRIGDRAGALHVYHEFRARLDREFSAEPATETKALGEALRVSRDPVPVSRPIAADPLPDEAPVAGSVPAVPASFVRRRRNLGRWALAAVLAGVVVLSAWSISRVTGNGERLSLGALTAADEVLVADIEAQPADSLTAYALTEVLRTELDASPAIRVVSRADLNQARIRMQLPAGTRIHGAIARDVAVRQGYEAILNAELTPVGSGYVLSAHLNSVAGAELATASEPAESLDALIDALGRLNKTLRSRLGESRQALVAIPPLQQVTTWSMRALELYTQAQDETNVSRGRGQQTPQMMEWLREALAIDSTFGMAHRRLGAAFHNLGMTHESLAEFRAAVQVSQRLTETERLFVLLAFHLNRQEYDRALAAANSLLLLKPGDLGTQNWLINLFLSSGQYDLAEKEIPRIAPVGDRAFWSRLREYQGRHAEAMDSARAFYSRYADSVGSPKFRGARQLLASFHAVGADYDSALRYALPHDTSDRGSPMVLAATRFARGQVAKALVIQSQRALRQDDELNGPSNTTAESYSALATMLITSDRVSANRRLNGVLADTSWRNRNPANRHIRPLLALALAGRAADARRELTAIEQASNEDVRIARRSDLDLAHGAVALAENHPHEAIAALSRVSGMIFTSLDACRVCALPWLGRAYEAAGLPDSATMVYERYLTTGDPFRVLSDAAWRAVILRRLGELHAQRGDTALAVKRLSEFVDLWKDADRELQPEVEKARQRITELNRNLLANRTRRSRSIALQQ